MDKNDILVLVTDRLCRETDDLRQSEFDKIMHDHPEHASDAALLTRIWHDLLPLVASVPTDNAIARIGNRLARELEFHELDEDELALAVGGAGNPNDPGILPDGRND